MGNQIYFEIAGYVDLDAPTNMATVTKNRTYGKIAGFWVITQKPLIISEI
jgi:hypothetical protein